MTLSLAQVTDTDCVRSTSPLVIGRMPGRYVTGVAAILRRVLYAWVLQKGILRQYGDPAALTFGESAGVLEGATFSDRQILGMRRRFEVSATREDYVLSATVPVSFDGWTLSIPGSILLVDGATYPLELSLSTVGAALDALGV